MNKPVNFTFKDPAPPRGEWGRGEVEDLVLSEHYAGVISNSS